MIPGGSDGCTTCPFHADRSPDIDFPIGQVRRVAHGFPAHDGDVDETKRNVLKLAGVAALAAVGGGGLVGGAIQYVQPPSVGLSSYPKVYLTDVDGGPLTVEKVESE